MGIFGKKVKEEKKQQPSAEPKASFDLPDLPDFAKFDNSSEDFSSGLPQLPSFPDSPSGKRFSQSTIKQAVTGEEEVGDEDFADYEPKEDEIGSNLQKSEPPKKVLLRKEAPSSFKESYSMVKKTEPLFIRIDKFEESMETLRKTKEQVSEIEKMLSDVKQVKEKESKELEYWENEIRSIKERIEKINSNLFSRIE